MIYFTWVTFMYRTHRYSTVPVLGGQLCTSTLGTFVFGTYMQMTDPFMCTVHFLTSYLCTFTNLTAYSLQGEISTYMCSLQYPVLVYYLYTVHCTGNCLTFVQVNFHIFVQLQRNTCTGMYTHEQHHVHT